jgi:hypothetical protein
MAVSNEFQRWMTRELRDRTDRLEPGAVLSEAEVLDAVAASRDATAHRRTAPKGTWS